MSSRRTRSGTRSCAGAPKPTKMSSPSLATGFSAPGAKSIASCWGRWSSPDAAKLKRLNSLVHPHVFRRQQAFFEALERGDPHGIGVVEAAIMIESGSYKRYDRLIVTVCPPEMQVRRFIERGGTEQGARDRLARQLAIGEETRFRRFHHRHLGQLCRNRRPGPRCVHTVETGSGMRKQIGWRPFWLAALMSAAFVLWTTSPRWLAREAPVLPPADPFWTEAQSSGLTDEETGGYRHLQPGVERHRERHQHGAAPELVLRGVSHE